MERALNSINETLKEAVHELRWIRELLEKAPVGFTIKETALPDVAGKNYPWRPVPNLTPTQEKEFKFPTKEASALFKASADLSTAIQERLKGEHMTLAKATADLQILDDGKGVLFTLTPVNRAGAPEPLPSGITVTGTSSAPASLANPIPDPGDPNATPPRPPDTTGLVFLSTVPQPPVDAVSVVVTFTAPFGSTAANPVDVTADDSPVGFTITESAL
jgi:hypothetical protein